MTTQPGLPTCVLRDCTAIQVEGFNHCLRHLKPDRLEEFLATLKPGADLDFRGTIITDNLLARLLGAVRDDDGWYPSFGYVSFEKAEFEGVEQLGPLVVDTLVLDGARFTRSVRLDVIATGVSCVGTRFEDGVTMRLGSSKIDATRTIFGAPSSISGATEGRTDIGLGANPRQPAPPESRPVLLSLRHTDVSKLALIDVDLRECRFAGAHRLDQLRFEGYCPFAGPPPGWRWTRRKVIAEEYLWRGWPTDSPARSRVPSGQIAALYRSLRKAFEDSKNEAGAGDFYYGEMEMRRRSLATPRAERWILSAYWLLSGYGQRAGRALAAIVALIATVSVLLLTVGMPGEHLWAWPRVDQSVRIAMGAVVFRDAGQQLTSPGSWTVMIARFIGPVLLALAVLAIRARVKR